MSRHLAAALLLAVAGCSSTGGPRGPDYVELHLLAGGGSGDSSGAWSGVQPGGPPGPGGDKPASGSFSGDSDGSWAGGGLTFGWWLTRPDADVTRRLDELQDRFMAAAAELERPPPAPEPATAPSPPEPAPAVAVGPQNEPAMPAPEPPAEPATEPHEPAAKDAGGSTAEWLAGGGMAVALAAALQAFGAFAKAAAAFRSWRGKGDG